MKKTKQEIIALLKSAQDSQRLLSEQALKIGENIAVIEAEIGDLTARRLALEGLHNSAATAIANGSMTIEEYRKNRTEFEHVLGEIAAQRDLAEDLQRLVGEQKVGELTRSIANLKELLVSTVVDELIQGMAEKNRPELEVIFALSGFGNLQDNPGSLIGTNLQQALFNGIQPHEQRKKLYTETLKKLGIN